ncbi:uncharacterized protein LOC109706500 [Ananas comosus]|uniref:Uncharacterized protein LOC109706500 n=1 Tax=Ananas comosus TaxID=4615 RepID=A0A199VK48_ANACO|nr:uncharacterized protein LOC109706500 [Ananas comosus]XP_020082957.1 uncharacterized protein LOC109706500 [Ananas comosus]XP_020082958.1 uncharacterized protein LOC109706500 [Ananas comosus]XP_020082959.1 uncharacterized protein LOC109706500 [Ananas comosus]OAY77542.1 hypothetical protein ACMD2_09831 [Ananas comosus]
MLQQPPRVNLAELKSKIARRVGPDRARRYFGYLNALLSQKLSRAEFTRLCLAALGRENLALHNHLIRAVLANASHPTPPPHSLIARAKNSSCEGFKIKRYNEDVVRENGEIRESGAKRSRMEEKLTPQDEEEELRRSRGPLRAPLGIPFCPPSVGGARKPQLPSAVGGFGGCCDCGELCETEVLKRRMERIARAQGLGGVGMDCADVLNNGLDAYLKRLIRSCVGLVGARFSGHGVIKDLRPPAKPINGVWLPNHVNVERGRGLLEAAHEVRNNQGLMAISLQDFRVAMEVNPQQLGEDWPLLLEKICFRSFEE